MQSLAVTVTDHQIYLLVVYLMILIDLVNVLVVTVDIY